VTATGGLPILSYTAYATRVNTIITATGAASLSALPRCTYSVPASGATNTCTITGLRAPLSTGSSCSVPTWLANKTSYTQLFILPTSRDMPLSQPPANRRRAR
jgi:hypothetical protein